MDEFDGITPTWANILASAWVGLDSSQWGWAVSNDVQSLLERLGVLDINGVRIACRELDEPKAIDRDGEQLVQVITELRELRWDIPQAMELSIDDYKFFIEVFPQYTSFTEDELRIQWFLPCTFWLYNNLGRKVEFLYRWFRLLNQPEIKLLQQYVDEVWSFRFFREMNGGEFWFISNTWHWLGDWLLLESEHEEDVQYFLIKWEYGDERLLPYIPPHWSVILAPARWVPLSDSQIF